MPGLAVLCSGQGKQSYESFAGLLRYPELEVLFLHFMNSGIVPRKLEKYLNSPSDNPKLIFDNEVAQPFIVMQQIMIWELIKNIIPEVQVFAGYSLGELSAYGLSGIIGYDDLLRLAALRGRLMSASANPPQKMAAVIGIRKNILENICTENSAFISIINSENHFVCGMAADSLKKFTEKCRSSGAEKIVELPISIASHSPYMKNAALEFEKELCRTSFLSSGSGILSGIDGEKLFSKENMISTLTNQIASTIDWRACMESALSYGCRVFIETGPGNALCKMLLEAFSETEARSISDFNDIRMIKNWADTAIRRQS